MKIRKLRIIVKSIHDQRYIEVIAMLRKARERSGRTQSEVGHLLGRPQSYVSKVETCERRIDIVELLMLCRVVDATLAEVIPSEYIDLLGDAPHA